MVKKWKRGKVRMAAAVRPDRMPAWIMAGLLVVGVLTGRAAADQPAAAHFDGAGRLVLLVNGGDPLPVAGEIRAAGPAWAFTGQVTPWSATGVTYAVDSEGVQIWRGGLALPHGGRIRYEQRVEFRSGGVALRLAVTAENQFPTEGVFYYLQLPVRAFEGARADLQRGTATVESAVLPGIPRTGAEAVFLKGEADRVRINVGGRTVAVALDAPRRLAIQDDRGWNATTYSLVVPLGTRPGLVRPGDTFRLRLDLALVGEPDRTPVAIAVRAGRGGDRFDGFGGNFVYGLESPVATALVARLNPVWARFEAALPEWEPENDNETPDETDWARLEARDAPGSALRRRFELAARLAAAGTPICLSVWDLPDWLYLHQGRDRWRPGRRLDPALWPEALECVTSYLLHLRKRYGVEPALFSFNEPEIGVRVLFSADEHREAIRRFGARFAALGLKTRLLAGDVANPRGTESYGIFAVSDPAALAHIGGVSFHAWGGATPGEYDAWPAFARRFGLPLYCMELGLDPDVWKTPHELDTPLYAMRELTLIQELLARARPRAALVWQYADNYPLLRAARDEGDGWVLTETARFRFLEQLNRLTPRPAYALAAGASRPHVAVTAYRGGPGAARFVLHAANAGAARPAVVSGVPEGIDQLVWTRVGVLKPDAAIAHVPVTNGIASCELPAWSLVTLCAPPAPPP